MKIINLKLFSFKELGRQAKQNALSTYRHLNVDFEWWNDEYEDFVNLCVYLGITVDKASIRFGGFYSQGDGCAYSATVDLLQLQKAIQAEAWKAFAPLQEFKFPVFDIDERVMRLIEHGSLMQNAKIMGAPRIFALYIDLGIFVHSEKKSYDNIFRELEKLDLWLRNIAHALNRYLFRCLQNQYEFLTADTTIKESILFNDYLFTADGRAANHLEELAGMRTKSE